METWRLALFLHVALAVAAMMLIAVLHVALIQLRRATASSEMRTWVPVLRRVQPLVPIAALAVFGTGAWLIELSDGHISWGEGWMVVSIAGLASAELVGAVLLAPRSRALIGSILAAPDGVINEGLRQRTVDPTLWFGAHFATATYFGIVYLMTAQPSGPLASVVAVAVAVVIGLLIAVPFVRQRPRKPAADAGRSVRT